MDIAASSAPAFSAVWDSVILNAPPCSTSAHDNGANSDSDASQLHVDARCRMVAPFLEPGIP